MKSESQVCAAYDCDRTDLRARGYCPTHYYRLNTYGDPNRPGYSRSDPAKAKQCASTDCEDIARVQGFCTKHYHRIVRHGDPSKVIWTRSTQKLDPNSVCTVTGCSEPEKCAGMCKAHYAANRRLVRAEEYRVYKRRRRARESAGFVVNYTHIDVAARMAYWGNKCWMCGGPFEAVDHVKPLAKGGKDCPSNFRPACTKCNGAKKDKWFGLDGLHRFIK